MRHLLDSDEVVIRITNYDSTKMAGRFPIKGLRDMLDHIPCFQP